MKLANARIFKNQKAFVTIKKKKIPKRRNKTVAFIRFFFASGRHKNPCRREHASKEAEVQSRRADVRECQNSDAIFIVTRSRAVDSRARKIRFVLITVHFK